MNIFVKLLNLIKLWVILILIFSSSSQANLLNENKLNYKADLLFGNFNDKQNYLLAGVKVKLDNNWKIYWKNPGEAGLPPKIIFDKISNVSNVNLFIQNCSRLVKKKGIMFVATLNKNLKSYICVQAME